MHRKNQAREDLQKRGLQGADNAPTNTPQKRPETPTERLQDADSAPMKDYRVRLPESWWKALKGHAAQRGLKPSQLVREIVADYLRGK